MMPQQIDLFGISDVAEPPKVSWIERLNETIAKFYRMDSAREAKSIEDAELASKDSGAEAGL